MGTKREGGRRLTSGLVMMLTPPAIAALQSLFERARQAW